MAIDAKCPHCEKSYRLKEDLVGKKVTCANQDCRKVFNVVASAAAPQLDAETMAMAVLADEPVKEIPAETRIINMSCLICEHKWQVGWDMQGKNTLCPDCKHRQKVPEQKTMKAADWRTGGGGPSLAKKETLDNVTSARDTTMVSGGTLIATGVIDDGVEPVPTKVWVLRGLALATLLGAIGFTVWFFMARSSDRKTERMFEDFAKAADKEEFNEQPLARAALRMSGAEYCARLNDPAKLDRAIELYNGAMADLSAAPKGADRDCLCGELAISVLNLGGEGPELLDRKKITWLPQPPTNSRAQVRPNKAQEEGVRGSVSRVLQILQKNNADFDLRAAIVRRLARELIARKQIEVLLSSIGAGFGESERPEIDAQIGLELFRAGDTERAKKIAESLVTTLTANAATNPPAVSTPALWALTEIKGPTIIPEVGAGDVSDASRLAGVTTAILKKDSAKALEIATKAGKADPKVRALAVAAEYAEAPQQFLDAAEAILSKPDATLSPLPIHRLALIAATNNQVDKAKTIANAIADPVLKTWTLAEILRHRLKTDPNAADEKDAELPADPANVKDLQLGHVWGRLQLARHNGQRGDLKLARQYMDAWPKPFVAPFGPAGVMLGQQDRELGIK